MQKIIPEDDWRRKELEDIGVCSDLEKIRKAEAKLRSEAEATISIDDGMDAFIKH